MELHNYSFCKASVQLTRGKALSCQGALQVPEEHMALGYRPAGSPLGAPRSVERKDRAMHSDLPGLSLVPNERAVPLHPGACLN